MARNNLEVLKALDVARTQWYHFTAIVIAGMGFFTDAYDLFVITTVTKLLGRIYYYKDGDTTPGALPANVLAAVNGVALCGAFAGQLFFGFLGDKLGRKSVYGMTLMLMVGATIGSGLSFGRTPQSVMATLCFFRFWIGFGVGGDYPLSATIMSEYANKRTRGSFIAAVFAMQGFGILAGGVVSIIVSSAFNAKYKSPAFKDNHNGSTVPQADFVWRIILMFGAVPAGVTFYWRMKMPETARYTALVERNAKQAAVDMSRVLQVDINEEAENVSRIAETGPSYGLFSSEFMKRHGLHLLGTSITWFLLDIAYYSQNLFQKDVLTAVGWLPAANEMNAIEEVYRVGRAQCIIALCSTIPGYWFTVAFVDRVGRVTIQVMGFFFMTVFMLALAIPYYTWRGSPCGDKFCSGNHAAFVALYCFTFFFSNFGPNATTFIIPAELFPARVRSTCHGISAAAGKAGAIVGAFGFLYASQSTHSKNVGKGYHKGIGIKDSLLILGVTSAIGLFFTLLIPETKGRSLEEISGESDEIDGSTQSDSAIHPHSYLS